MPEVGRPQLAVYVAAAIAIALIGAHSLRQQPGAAGSGTGARSGAVASPGGRTPAADVRIDAAGGGWPVVQVVGAVRRPGVYRIRPGARADDAVRRAGGPLASADLAGVNLAAKVEDGRQVIVPIVATAAPAEGSAGAGPVVPAGSPAPGSATPGVAPAAPLNLNTATAEQLDQLDGVGPATAQKILAYRQAHGGFRSVAELGQVPGIGEKRLATLRVLVRV